MNQIGVHGNGNRSQASYRRSVYIDRLENEETMNGYRSGRNWLLHGELQRPITEEYLIDTIKLLISDGVFDGTQDELLYWHVGFCLGVMSGKTIPRTEGE